MQKVSQFYKNVDSFKMSGHPGYEFERTGDNSKIIGISHHEFNKILGMSKPTKFKKLKKNPEPNNQTIAYASPYPLKVKTQHLKNKVDWKFSNEDKNLIDNIKNRKSK